MMKYYENRQVKWNKLPIRNTNFYSIERLEQEKEKYYENITKILNYCYKQKNY